MSYEVPYWHSPEEEADFTAFCATADKWGWTWSVMVRGDVDLRIERPTTDEEWAKIEWDHEWRSIGDALDEFSNDMVNDVIDKHKLWRDDA
jgi:hypothetical protein